MRCKINKTGSIAGEADISVHLEGSLISVAELSEGASSLLLAGCSALALSPQ